MKEMGGTSTRTCGLFRSSAKRGLALYFTRTSWPHAYGLGEAALAMIESIAMAFVMIFRFIRLLWLPFRAGTLEVVKKIEDMWAQDL